MKAIDREMMKSRNILYKYCDSKKIAVNNKVQEQLNWQTSFLIPNI